jgi:Mg2+ and Co2+ transporter CorA
MKIEVSNGELLDKVSILEIKMEKITDKDKLRNISKEFNLLKPLAGEILGQVRELFTRLKDINRALWDIEDRIREFESRKDFGGKFVETARQVYRMNDERARIKKEINERTGSGLVEEKSYQEY